MESCQSILKDFLSVEIEDSWWVELLQCAHGGIDFELVLAALIRQNFHEIPFRQVEEVDPCTETVIQGKSYPRHKIFQIDEAHDVSQSLSGHEAKEKAGARKFSRRSLFKLSLTDGASILLALDAFSSSQLQGVPLCGAKIAIKLPLDYSMGIVLLSDPNFVFFGGAEVNPPEMKIDVERNRTDQTGSYHKEQINTNDCTPVALPPVVNNFTGTIPKSLSKKNPPESVKSAFTSAPRISSSPGLPDLPRRTGLIHALQMAESEDTWISGKMASLIPPLVSASKRFVVRCELRDGPVSAICYLASELIEKIMGISPVLFSEQSEEKKESSQQVLSLHCAALSTKDTQFHVEGSGKFGLVIKACV